MDNCPSPDGRENPFSCSFSKEKIGRTAGIAPKKLKFQILKFQIQKDLFEFCFHKPSTTLRMTIETFFSYKIQF